MTFPYIWIQPYPVPNWGYTLFDLSITVTDKKHPDVNKLEDKVKKYNVSKYFENKTEKLNPVSVTKNDFSAKDEEQFNNILSSAEKNSKID